MENTIRVERAKKKITQAELAERVDVSRQTIHAIETGKFIPSTVLALKIRCSLPNSPTPKPPTPNTL